MYAIFQSGGHQYRAEPGHVINVERLTVESGESVTFDDVLLIGGPDVRIGQPTVAGASVRATVLGEVKGKKIIVQRYKPKNRYKITRGHRQKYTKIRIENIELA